MRIMGGAYSELANGMTFEEVMREYDLKKADTLGALDYAAKTLANEEIKI